MVAKVPPAKVARLVEWIRHHLYRFHQRLTPAPAAMIEMILAGWTSQAITVAAQLGVADALSDGPLPIDELAARVNADVDALRRLLRALISRGVFRHRRDGRYELNSLADTLRSDARPSMRSAARFYGSQEQRERWTLLVDSVRTGTSVVPVLRGKSSFEYFDENPGLSELFDQTMTSVSELTDAPVVAGFDFGAYPTIVDVGGGHGALLATILTAAPASRGVLYDLHRVVANASNLFRQYNVADRVRIEEGSFFDGVPSGGDAYVLKNIIHDWPDETAVGILRNVHAAAGPRSTLLLVEFVIPEHDRDFPGKWVDLEMLLNLGARERTAIEYRDLLGQAGFRMTRLAQTASPLSVIEARPA
jgi:C-methyltransferase